ncbi:MAG TPA: hypothetical protein VN903_30910, partial [Polyangia bacterium]|nr:hypothetical protein [Polyangia bacterium]
MNAYVAVDPPRLGQALHRVARALATYAPPEVQIVESPDDADLVVCHLIGWAHWEDLRSRMRGDQRYAVVQYCLRTTERPNADNWWWPWANADVVWSYYDLTRLMVGNFYHAPLGIDPAFVPCGCGKPYLVGTSGYVDGMEAISEWSDVCQATGRAQFHLGPHLGLPGSVTYANGLTDAQLAKAWGT